MYHLSRNESVFLRPGCYVQNFLHDVCQIWKSKFHYLMIFMVFEDKLHQTTLHIKYKRNEKNETAKIH